MSYFDNRVTFCGVNIGVLQLPRQLPTIDLNNDANEIITSEGVDGSPIRIIEPLYAHLSHSNFEFAAGPFTASQVTTFETAYFDPWTAKTLVIRNGDLASATYSCAFAKGGFKKFLQDSLVGYEEDMWLCVFKLHILKQV